MRVENADAPIPIRLCEAQGRPSAEHCACSSKSGPSADADCGHAALRRAQPRMHRISRLAGAACPRGGIYLDEAERASSRGGYFVARTWTIWS
jgi:hypothetical protein